MFDWLKRLFGNGKKEDDVMVSSKPVIDTESDIKSNDSCGSDDCCKKDDGGECHEKKL